MSKLFEFYFFCIFFIISSLLLSCETYEPTITRPFEIINTTWTQIGDDSVLQSPLLEIRDTSLFAAMNDIIVSSMALRHSSQGEKTWYQLCFEKDKDTFAINLIANQYFPYSDLQEKYIFGVFYYKGKLFTVKRGDEIPLQFIRTTNDTVTLNKMYQGTTVYYYENANNNRPEYILTKYKYNNYTWEKCYTILNDTITH